MEKAHKNDSLKAHELQKAIRTEFIQNMHMDTFF